MFSERTIEEIKSRVDLVEPLRGLRVVVLLDRDLREVDVGLADIGIGQLRFASDNKFHDLTQFESVLLVRTDHMENYIINYHCHL